MTDMKSEQLTEVCPIKLVHQYQFQKMGLVVIARDSEIHCPATCEGLRSEPRTIGRHVLPSMFDRIYCADEQQTAVQS